MNTQTKKSVKESLLRILEISLTALLILIGFLCFFSATWYVSTYGRIGFDSVLYTLFSDLGGVQSSLVSKYLLGAGLPAVLATAAVSLLLFLKPKKALCITLGKRSIQLYPFSSNAACGISVLLSLILIVHAAFNVQLVDYLFSVTQKTGLYEEEYRDPNQVSITFPEEKRNLVYIILESMETSFLSEELGGGVENNLIPELYELAQNNINFSHNDDVGGFREVTGTSWTVGSMVAQTSGVPLKTPDNVSDWQNGYGKDGVFLPGLTTLNNILADNGYYQALMVGSDANFGGRKTYFSTHEMDRIYDIYTARADGIVEEDYFVWWGMEDLYLYQYAKQALTDIASQDQPFAFTMLTVDTHHVGGYYCAYCQRDYDEHYDNVYACASRQLAAFLGWLQQQPFYENTTVVITGDHCSMDAGYFTRNVESDYVRHVYNCFVNAAATPVNTANRQFSALDMFPSTLAAMGCTIEGDRLGLGTNLFSSQQTLIEQMGYDAFCEELSKRSTFYAGFYTP